MALENDHGSRDAPAIAGCHQSGPAVAWTPIRDARRRANIRASDTNDDWRRSVAELVPAADAALGDKADQIAALFLKEPAESFVPVPTEPPGLEIEMFDIVTCRDFLAKLNADFDDFLKQQDSARLALNCIVTAYHLHEWVWGDWLKTDHAAWKQLGIRDKETFIAWIEHECPRVQNDPGPCERRQALHP